MSQLTLSVVDVAPLKACTVHIGDLCSSLWSDLKLLDESSLNQRNGQVVQQDVSAVVHRSGVI